MCMIDDSEPCDVYVSKNVVARKPWKCSECNSEIAVGQQYHRATMLFEGFWDTYRMCMACYRGPALWLTEQCGGFVFYGVYEDLYEHWEERGSLGISDAQILALGRMLVQMRRRRSAGWSRAA